MKASWVDAALLTILVTLGVVGYQVPGDEQALQIRDTLSFVLPLLGSAAVVVYALQASGHLQGLGDLGYGLLVLAGGGLIIAWVVTFPASTSFVHLYFPVLAIVSALLTLGLVVSASQGGSASSSKVRTQAVDVVRVSETDEGSRF